MPSLSYPKSFPNSAEASFLKVVLTSDADFPEKWNDWKQKNTFDDINYATLRLIPLIYLRMKKLGMDDELYGRIKGIYKTAWVKNQRLLAAVRDISEKCAEKGIPLLLLKGIPLLLDVYKDVGARFTGDADIVVPPEYAPKTVALMLESGWHYSKPWMPDVNNPMPSMYEVIKSTDFENNNGVAFDVHWNIFGLYHHVRPLDIVRLKKEIPSIAFRDAYLASAVPLELSGTFAKRLCNEDMLLHVVIHGSEGNIYRTLRWVTDAAAIIQTLPLDWDFILKRILQFNLAAETEVAFHYLSVQMGITIPKDFLDTLSSIPHTKNQVREFYKRANLIGGERFSPLNNLLMFWYAYWIYEPKKKFPKTIFGFIHYSAMSLGMNRPGVFPFVMKKYFKKIWRQLTNIALGKPTG